MRRCTSALALGVLVLAHAGWAQYHAADSSQDQQIQLSELLRVIQFFNSSGYHCAEGTEDGYAPGTGEIGCDSHDSDYLADADFTIELSELLRLVQLFNSGFYFKAADGEDGFAPWYPGDGAWRPEADGLLGYFHSVDSDGSQELSLEELTSGSIPMVPEFFALLDADGNGRLSRYEFLDATRWWNSAGLPADTMPPVVSLEGPAEITIECGEEVPFGATAYDEQDGDLSAAIYTGGLPTFGVSIGTYVVSYFAADGAGNIGAAQRVVHVVDVTPPVITLKGPAISYTCPGQYQEAGAVVTENCAPNPGLKIDTSGFNEDLEGEYTITYTATDVGGNSTTVTRQVVVGSDEEAPVMVLKGPNPKIVNCQSPYYEHGVEIIALCDPAPELVIDNSSVDTSVLGEYIVTYTVTDSAGRVFPPVMRSVIVADTAYPDLANPTSVSVLGLNGVYVPPDMGASDLCGEPVQHTVDASALITSSPGVYSVMHDFTDVFGNTRGLHERVVVLPEEGDFVRLALVDVECWEGVYGKQYTIVPEPPYKDLYQDMSETHDYYYRRGTTLTMEVSQDDFYIDGQRVRGSYTLTDDTEATIEGDPYWCDGSHLEEYDEAPARLSTNGFATTTVDSDSSFFLAVDDDDYLRERHYIEQGYWYPTTIDIDEFINHFDYQYPLPQQGSPFSVYTETAECPWAEGHRLLHVGLQTPAFPEEERPPANLVFLVDTSASMNAPGLFSTLNTAFADFVINELDEQDRVAIVTHDAVDTIHLPSTPCTGTNPIEIAFSMNRLVPEGSRQINNGLKLAFDEAQRNFIPGGINRVIFATSTWYQSQLGYLAARARGGISFSSLIFYAGALDDWDLVSAAAKEYGTLTLVNSPLEADRALTESIGSTGEVVAEDASIHVHFNPDRVEKWRLIGFENGVKGKDYESVTGAIRAGRSITALYELIPTNTKAARDDIAALIDLRYKLPLLGGSRTLTHVIDDTGSTLLDASTDFKFAAGVAAFGMLLQDSPHIGTADWNLVRSLGEDGLGEDRFGYRAEFLELVDKAEQVVP
jgi:Ca-activated chloride channel family protein